MFADFNYQNFVQLGCSACHMVIHTFFVLITKTEIFTDYFLIQTMNTDI